MKQNFRGWTSVYSFTFRQSTKGIAFKLLTVLIAVIIIGAIVLATVVKAKSDDKDKPEPSPIKTVYILDNSGLMPTDYKNLNPELQTERYKKISYVDASDMSREEAIAACETSKEAIAVIISTSDTGYQMEAVIPSGSSISQKQAGKLLTQMSSAFDTNKLMQTGLTTEQLTAVLIPDVTSYADIGENTNEIVFVIKLIAPMLFCFMFYMMLMLYGQTVSKSVATEKTSKLMETLLTSVHPYALITGKVLAVTSMALLQFLSWLLSAFVGLYGGNAIAHSLYPEYKNGVITVFNFLRDNIGQTALTPPAIVLAILFFCIGFLFYCVIAGLAGSMASKPDDVAAAQQLFMFPMLISFGFAYVAPLTHNEALIRIIRYIPFTSPFSVPSDLITGTIGLGEGALTLLILAIFSLLVIILSGRIYKGLVLYNGQKLSLKMIGNVLKSNH